MSGHFYRRDYESYKLSRREDDESSRDGERSRDRSSHRSVSRSAISSRTTEEWAPQRSRSSSQAPQPIPSTDPRLRNNAVKGLVEDAHSSTPGKTTASSMAVDGPADVSDKRNASDRVHVPTSSLVDSIASVLINFSTEAYSAGYAKQREEVAKQRLAAAEKTDQQNRRGHMGWTTLIEQGEEDKRTAVKSLEDAKKQARGTAVALSAAATTAATRIVDITNAGEGGNSEQSSHDKEAERFARVESLLSTLTDNLTETQKALQELRTNVEAAASENTTVRTGIIDPLVFTVSATRKEVTTLSQQVEAMNASQQKVETSETSLNTTVTDLRHHIKSELGTLRAQLQKVETNTQLSKLEASSAKEFVRPELYAKHETLARSKINSTSGRAEEA